jgi:hypothetical protein
VCGQGEKEDGTIMKRKLEGEICIEKAELVVCRKDKNEMYS